MTPLFISEMKPLHREGLDALESDEAAQLKSMIDRLSKVAAHAAGKNVSLMIDAEQSYMQPAIDQVALGLMRKYNSKFLSVLWPCLASFNGPSCSWPSALISSESPHRPCVCLLLPSTQGRQNTTSDSGMRLLESCRGQGGYSEHVPMLPEGRIPARAR